MATPSWIEEGGPRRSSGLQRLPCELLFLIAEDLSLEEFFNMSLCCRQFLFMVQDENLCRRLMRSKAFHSVEAHSAEKDGLYARSLRRLVKRRQAIEQASPYFVGILALADSFEYCNGTLCYVLEARPQRWLRLLDLHNSASTETVVDIPSLVSEAIPRSSPCRKYKFKVLHHANNITSCLYSFALPTTEDWLLVFNAQKQELISVHRLDSASRLFVRNNAEYLYYGSHSEVGTDGFRRWVICGFDIKKQKWFPNKLHLANLVGYDIGSTVCFEVIDGYFYGLSNQNRFEVEEIDWTSFYYCFRFRLNEPEPSRTQILPQRKSWRRQHIEGPLDDRWGSLALRKDEASGAIWIVESRKEWLEGQSESWRTYYSKEITFSDEDVGALDEDDSDLPDEPLARMVPSGSKPSYMAPQRRSVHDVHRGDDGAVTSVYTRSKTHLRAYHRASNTFLDIVDDRSPQRPEVQCLRLRTGTRYIAPRAGPGEPPPPLLAEDGPGLVEENTYQPNIISKWPPEQNTPQEGASSDRLLNILNPPGFQGEVAATFDERSILYSTGGEDAPRCVIFLSFDPAVRLTGSRRGTNGLGEASEKDGNSAELRSRCERKTTEGISEKVTGSPNCISGFTQLPSKACVERKFSSRGSHSRKPWVHTDKPLYEQFPDGQQSLAWTT